MQRLPGLRRLFRHEDSVARVRRDVDEEIAFHLDAVTAELVAGGMSQAEARREAERRFGNLEAHRTTLRDEGRERVTRARWRLRVEEIAGDLRYAARGLVREPLFALGAILTLGIGIAANATMFGVIDRLLLRAPPHVSDAPEMSLVYLQRQDDASRIRMQTSTSWPDFATFRDSSGVVASAAAFWVIEGSLEGGVDAQKVRVGLATGNFFTTLGAQVARGRWYGPAEDEPTVTEPPVVLSDGIWRGRYAADAAIIGKTIHVNQRTYTVVGIAPPGFHGPSLRRVDMWVPLRVAAKDFLGDDWETSRDWYWLRIVARRKADVPQAMANERATLSHQLANRTAKKGDSLTRIVFASVVPARGAGTTAVPGVTQVGQSGMSSQGRIAAWLGGVAVIVLLIVCANLANLLLSRASKRRREIAVRLAMGVRRGRLVRQLLGETLLLALAGGSLGLLLAWWGTLLMRRVFLSELAWETPAVDARVALFTLGASLLTVLVAGLAPALLASRLDLTSALKSATRDGGHRRTKLQRTLLVAQAALSVVLLVGAGLFVRSLRNVATLRMGFDTENVLVASIDVSKMSGEPGQFRQFWNDAAERVRGIPGVASVSLAMTTPFESSWATDFSIPGRDSLPELRGDGPYINVVSNNFLSTMGTRVTRGRGFLPTDVKGTEQVAIINEEMAARLWPKESPLGKCIKVGADSLPCTTIVGVMEDAYRDDIKETKSPQYFVSLEQATFFEARWRTLFLRAAGDPAAVTARVREQLQTLRPDLPYAEVRTMDAVIAPQLEPWRLGASMFGLFGAIALVVAAIGLYAVVAYDVSQRWHELGVRSALGARPRHILGLIVGDGVRHALLGLVVGAAITWVIAPRAGDMLFGIGPRDPVTFGVVAGVLLVAATIACLMPARRASRVAPAEVLRSD